MAGMFQAIVAFSLTWLVTSSVDMRSLNHAEKPSDKEVGSASPTIPQSSNGELPELVSDQVGGPYCGVSSLRICLSALGIDIEPKDFISPKYVGSFQGSSAEELIDAATDFGAQAEGLSHLTHRELTRIETPLILHMRSNLTSRGFNHWVAFLGCESDGRFRIADAPHPLQLLSPAELLANWDGTAIAIARGKVDHAFLSQARIDYFIWSGLVLLAIYVLRTVLSSSSSLQAINMSLVLQVMIVVGFSLLLGVVYHNLSDVGFLKNPTATAEVVRRNFSVDIPVISLSDLEEEIQEGELLVLDARHTIDFSRGALPGAKNMSVGSTLYERQRTLAGVAKSKRIIVYCQSAACGYDDEVAKFLKFNGYTNIGIFRDGYRGWHEAHASARGDMTAQNAAKNKVEDDQRDHRSQSGT